MQAKSRVVKPFKTQLLKWVGSKQRLSHEIAGYFPGNIKRYYEPFLGSGAVLGTLAPECAIGSDVLSPLIEIWKTLRESPDTLKEWYYDRWSKFSRDDRVEQYERIKKTYNESPNGADLLFLCRSCYGGVIRFRQSDGFMSTPCGPHKPVSPDSFAKRVSLWHERVTNTRFELLGYEESMSNAKRGDLIYCDPPYVHTQKILYGSHVFSLQQLLCVIAECKRRGVYVALSIDGTKRSGNDLCDLPIPEGLFKREIFLDCGRSMLKRFKMDGQNLEKEAVTDRLLLTY